jgi:hypothetical protein
MDKIKSVRAFGFVDGKCFGLEGDWFKTGETDTHITLTENNDEGRNILLRKEDQKFTHLRYEVVYQTPGVKQGKFTGRTLSSKYL